MASFINASVLFRDWVTQEVALTVWYGILLLSINVSETLNKLSEIRVYIKDMLRTFITKFLYYYPQLLPKSLFLFPVG